MMSVKLGEFTGIEVDICAIDHCRAKERWRSLHFLKRANKATIGVVKSGKRQPRDEALAVACTSTIVEQWA